MKKLGVVLESILVVGKPDIVQNGGGFLGVCLIGRLQARKASGTDGDGSSVDKGFLTIFMFTITWFIGPFEVHCIVFDGVRGFVIIIVVVFLHGSIDCVQGRVEQLETWQLFRTEARSSRCNVLYIRL